MPFRLHYNAPVILTFSLICVLVYVADSISGGNVLPYFALKQNVNFDRLSDYPGLLLYIFGHSGLNHLVNNLTFLLLLGPIIEEKYGAQRLLIMIFLTTLFTAILNIVLFKSGLIGASGIVFMLIMLVSFTNFSAGRIPLTFVAILILFIGKEFIDGFKQDEISQFAHIIGGFCGSIFGFTKGLKK
ncbi:MAG: rhomboid family intramembrane serine protease [Chitinophagales bacterium]